MSPDDAVSHPQPSLRRPWFSLDGVWDFACDSDAALARPEQVTFDRTIEVPFAPETPASGINLPDARLNRVWYRRPIPTSAAPGARLVAHFGAVDRIATVWVNGAPVVRHEGGYTPFAVDITDYANGGSVDLVVQADDDPSDLSAPRGKQDWTEPSHGIWYPRTTGIWRTVWLEQVPATSIAELRWTGDPASMTLALEATISGLRDGLRLAVRVEYAGRVLVNDAIQVVDGSVSRTFAIGDGGFDDAMNLLWWPRRPTLFETTVALVDTNGDVVDEVRCETSLRSVSVDDGHVLLNGRPYPLRLVLDQGYWPESGATPPNVEALQRDIELTKALGFNGARKHQKTEDPRYLALADRLGLLVWAEMPSAYAPGTASAARLLAEWADIVRAHRSHPSVMAWVPVNESWGVPALENDARQRALIRALGDVAVALDGTRPVSVNDGWETIGGDIVGVHDYTQDAAVLRERFGTRDAVDALLHGRRWDGRLADLDRRASDGRAVVLSEFGGVALRDAPDDAGWGYTEASSPDDLLNRYREQWAAVHASDALAGACWTQLTDTYQEINGLLRADRTPKVPLEDLAAATRGR